MNAFEQFEANTTPAAQAEPTIKDWIPNNFSYAGTKQLEGYQQPLHCFMVPASICEVGSPSSCIRVQIRYPNASGTLKIELSYIQGALTDNGFTAPALQLKQRGKSLAQGQKWINLKSDDCSPQAIQEIFRISDHHMSLIVQGAKQALNMGEQNSFQVRMSAGSADADLYFLLNLAYNDVGGYAKVPFKMEFVNTRGLWIPRIADPSRTARNFLADKFAPAPTQPPADINRQVDQSAVDNIPF